MGERIVDPQDIQSLKVAREMQKNVLSVEVDEDEGKLVGENNIGKRLPEWAENPSNSMF